VKAVACPFVFPTEKSNTVFWAFPRRLPLGSGYCGTCTAAPEQLTPNDDELRELCNIGYARECQKLPAERHSDAIRFAVAKDGGSRILLHYSCERDHAPVEHGQLQYDCTTRTWPVAHADACVQRQAEVFVAGYLERRGRIG
jgi:hypothetical protein